MAAPIFNDKKVFSWIVQKQSIVHCFLTFFLDVRTIFKFALNVYVLLYKIDIFIYINQINT